jgi:hypothetical protein
VADLPAQAKAEFLSNFPTRYRSALTTWCDAYAGHVPFSPDAVTPDKLAERVGAGSSFEYIFIVDGVTLGIQDKNGIAHVSYLNAPQPTNLMHLSDGTQAPTLTTPVTREQVSQMLVADAGTAFTPQEIRMVPTGLSSALNGGVHVNVGGDPNNGFSWKYTMVFGPDGNLAYYLKGFYAD